MVGTFRLSRSDGGGEDSWGPGNPTAAPTPVPAPALRSAPPRAPALKPRGKLPSLPR